MSNKWLKILIFIFMVIYVVSPVDLCPGPIDDMIVVLLGMAAQKRNWLPE